MTGLPIAAYNPFGISNLDIAAEPGTPDTPFVDTSGRVRVPPLSSQTTLTLLVAGQSLAANNGDTTTYQPAQTAQVLNLNPYDGLVYQLRDPVLGTSGTMGSWISRLGDLLIEKGVCQRVIFVPIAVDGTAVAEWAPGGDCNQKLVAGLRRVIAAGLNLSAVLWAQGVQDNKLNSTQAYYQQMFYGVMATIRAFSNCPVFISVQSMFATATNANVTAAQAALVQVGAGTYAGANFDVLGTGSNRKSDGTHLTDAGNAAAAALWLTALQAVF